MGDIMNSFKLYLFCGFLSLALSGCEGFKSSSSNSEPMNSEPMSSDVAKGLAATSVPIWNNDQFAVGSFSITFDAVPLLSVANGEDSVIGLSNGVAATYTDLAAIVRFGANGIDARNGGTYQALTNAPYTAGMTYSIEMDVNVTSHTYNVYITPSGGSEIAIAQNFAFRSEQASVTNITDFAYYSDVGGVMISNVKISISLVNPIGSTSPPPTPSPTPSPINGTCGSANGISTILAPNAKLCTTGVASSVTGAGPFLWSCEGSNGGSNASCSAPLKPTPINGVCGTENGVAASNPPSANLCSSGTASTVTGTGPFAWSCAGINGGTNGSCSAPLASIPTAPMPDITSFAPASNSFISVDGSQYQVQNANQTWSINSPDTQTLRFQVNPGDVWSHDGTPGKSLTTGSYLVERSEIAGSTQFQDGTTINVSYNFMIEAGAANTDEWTILGQLHNTDIGALAPNPPFGFVLYGEQLNPFGYYLLSGKTTNTSINLGAGIPITRGQYYSIRVSVNFLNNANGFAMVWVNGVQKVNYHGPIGYGQPVYWKEGIYRQGGDSPRTNTMNLAVDYQNLVITNP
jgi:hypothetical protein